MGSFKYPQRLLSRLSTQQGGADTDPDYENVSLLFQPGELDEALVDRGPLALTLTAVGNAALSTAISDPWGGARQVLRCDGVGDYVDVLASDGFSFGTGAGTIEGWIYADVIDAALEHYLFSTGATEQTGVYLGSGASDAGKVTAVVSGVTNIARTSAAASALTWSHIALSWDDSGNIYTWLDGGSGGTATEAGAKGANEAAFIGAFSASFPTAAAYLTGIRVTKGVARYTSPFQPPRDPFPTQ